LKYLTGLAHAANVHQQNVVWWLINTAVAEVIFPRLGRNRVKEKPL